jgi:hypothetical protein
MIKAQIEVIGSLIACSEGIRDDWREITQWLGEKLNALYDGQVDVRYYDLFDEPKPELPENARLPVVMINHKVMSQGEKISVPEIRNELQKLGL